MGFKFQLLPITEGYNFIMPLRAFMTIQCTKARSSEELSSIQCSGAIN
jgi:hypothetical protein